MSRVLRHGLRVLACILAGGGALAFAQVSTVDELSYPELPAFQLPRPARTVLPNGMVVLVMENRDLPLVSVTARIRTGSLLEPADKTGLASLTGSVLRAGGTETMSPDALDLFLEDRAASIESGIGDDAGTASMSVLRDDFRDVLRMFADVLRRPRFDEGRLQLAKRSVEAGIARQNDDAAGIAAREFRKLLYGADSPFARQVTYDTLAAITREDLQAWHAAHVHPNRMILGVHGDISQAEAVAALTEAFGDWPRGPGDEVRFPEPAAASPAGVYEVVKPDVEQSSIRIGHQGSLVSTHPDYYPVQILNEVLSGSFTSRLFSVVRTEKGLAYSVGGSVGSQFTRVAPFAMVTSTKTSTTIEAIETLKAEARRIISEPPTDEEIRQAKQSILNSFIFNSATTQQVLGQQLTYEYYGVPADWLDRYRAGIEQVTREEVASVAERYIHPDRFAVLVVGPSEGRDKPLTSIGPVTTLDVEIPPPSSTAPATGGGESAPEAMAAGQALLAQALAAQGGAAAVNAVVRYREVLSAVVETPQGALTIENTVTLVLPDRLAQEMATPMGRLALVVTPERGTVVTQTGARQPMPAAQREQVVQQMQRMPLVLIQRVAREGLTGADVGEAHVDGTPVRLVRVVLGTDSVVLGIDPANGQVRSLAYRGTGPTGAPTDLLTEFSDFRPVEGPGEDLLIAHRRQTRMGDALVQQVTVERVDVNPAVDPALFDDVVPQGGASEPRP